MGCWIIDGMIRWRTKLQRMQEKMDRVRARWTIWTAARMVGHPAVERQPRLRRLPQRNAAPA